MVCRRLITTRLVLSAGACTSGLDSVPPGTSTDQLWTADGGFHDARSLEVTVGSTGIDLGTPG